MKKSIKILASILLALTLTGCTKTLKDRKRVVQNPETGQNLVSNILCKPENEITIELYKQHNVEIDKLPSCNDFKISSTGYDGIWTTLFVKPLALVIIKLGNLVKNYGLAVIILTILIRLVMYPITKKTALQSENMKKAKPELDKLEKKYNGKTDQESMMQKSQEMMMIYKKNNINPLSECLFSFIQITLFFSFYEALNRLPIIFEETLLGFQLGTSPLIAIKNGNLLYIMLIILVAVTTILSFKLNKTISMNKEQEKQMKFMTNMSIILIIIASFSMSVGIEIYWIITNMFTAIQNIILKRKKY